MASAAGPEPLLLAEGVSKRFGSTQALREATLTVAPGELVGLAGHNGAGKSTLLRSVTALVRPDEGRIEVRGTRLSAGASVKEVRALGVRTVHQELSLCPALRVDESAALVDRTAKGPRWRRRAWRSLGESLDDIFPGHGIRPGHRIADLSIARRQMVEIAAAALPGEGRIELLILDEPTSSLDAEATQHLYRWLRAKAGEGMGAIVTTHRLNEMLAHLDRLYVMRDGQVVVEEPTTGLRREALVELMGGAGAALGADVGPPDDGPREQASVGGAQEPKAGVLIDRLTTADLHDVSLQVGAGEIVGLAGLEGHGQRAVLDAVFRAAWSGRAGRRRSVRVDGRAAYVSGDRTVEGVFRYWDVARNVSASSLGKLTRWGLVSSSAERQLVASWSRRLDIRGETEAPILNLSGGNQQKAMVARAFATGAEVILLDDPTRGVDQGTKEQLCRILREEAAAGKCVIWYSTENDELVQCDRLYVLRAGRVAEMLEGADRNEARIIGASFQPVGAS